MTGLELVGNLAFGAVAFYLAWWFWVKFPASQREQAALLGVRPWEWAHQAGRYVGAGLCCVAGIAAVVDALFGAWGTGLGLSG